MSTPQELRIYYFLAPALYKTNLLSGHRNTLLTATATTIQSPPMTTSLPTFDKLGVEPPQDVDAERIARAWVQAFNQFVSSRDAKGVLSTIHEDGWWRDLFALTWDLRTFQDSAKIGKFLEDKLVDSGFSNINFISASYAQMFPDMGLLTAQFDFETTIARGRGLVRLVPTKDGWKAATICTNLEDLKDYPEAIGPLRNHLPNHGKWADARRQEKEFADQEPEVLIIGGGQNGLEIAARLKQLGVTNLIIEKQPRVGDQWRTRYEALCLHDPVCEYTQLLLYYSAKSAKPLCTGADHLPYMKCVCSA